MSQNFYSVSSFFSANMLTRLCVILYLLKCLAGSPPPKVILSGGVVVGTNYRTLLGRDAYAFFGVPYAAPPIGENRFESPKPVKPWIGEYNAAVQTSPCLQYFHPTYSILGEEDCLYLDIYTPKLPCEEQFRSMDVIVYIHGGAFMFGTGISEKGDYLITYHEVVYVTINYRLGPLGFLSTGDDEVPGNNGLKDQSMALRWVKNNIAQFGGNPNSVTILGTSAGGASVHYHYLSPMSRGLFHRGASQSGVNLVSGAQPRKVVEKSKRLANLLGCPTNCTKEMILCLKSRPAKKIVEYVKDFLAWRYTPFVPFGPVVEPPGKGRFLTEKPLDIIRAGKVYNVPWLTSVTAQEGLYPVADFINNASLMNQVNDDWNFVAPNLLDYNLQVPEDQLDAVSQKIRDHFFKDEQISTEHYQTLVQVVGDRLYTAYTEFAIREQLAANPGPIYYYKFHYRGKYSYSNVYTHDNKDYGVSHGDDTMYVSKTNYGDPHDNSEDKKMLDVMQAMWGSYSQSGKPVIPNVTWPEVSKNTEVDGITFVKLYSPEHIQLENTKDTSIFDFWNSTLNEYSARN